ERGLSPRTVAAYSTDLTRWRDFMVERNVARPAAVTGALLHEGVYGLRDAGLAAPSIRRAPSALGADFACLLAEGRVSDDPTERMAAPVVERRLPHFLTMEEVERLLEAPDPSHRLFWRDRAVLELLYASGMRVSELAELPLSALDLHEGFAT